MTPVELSTDLSWIESTERELQELHDLLATAGVTRGLIGPREVPRLWSRHIRNCLVVADPSLDLVPQQARVVDIGTGAGLPGLVWAMARPDLAVTLLEPLQRRTRFLEEAVTQLGLSDRVTIVVARAQDTPNLKADIATSRALAPLPTVVEWSLPHLVPGGTLLAIKGSKAADELKRSREAITNYRGLDPRVISIGPQGEDGHPLARVVAVTAGGTRGR